MYRPKTCIHCGDPFTPTYANQRVHAKCRRAWRLKYQRVYQREYQRRVRKEMKQDWTEEPAG